MMMSSEEISTILYYNKKMGVHGLDGWLVLTCFTWSTTPGPLYSTDDVHDDRLYVGRSDNEFQDSS